MRFLILAPLLACAAAIAGSAQAASHYGKQIDQIQVDARTCLFFNLQGVLQADPAVANQSWFALPVGHTNYQTLVSLLVSAKISHQPVSVQTDSSVSCGYATMSLVTLN